MMYEAVSSGAATGVLQLDSTRRNRAVQCVDLLLEAGDVTSWQQWVDSGSMQCSGRTLAEADRCAAEILRRIEWSSRTSDTARNAA